MSRSRDAPDERASLKVVLQMEQVNYPSHKMSIVDIEPSSLDKAVVHMGDLMISMSLMVFLLDTEADNQQKTLIIKIKKECGINHTLLYIWGKNGEKNG